MPLTVISAGAGSGKTYRLTSEMVNYLTKDVRPSGIIATTFTSKAAAELQERVRVRLLETGMREAADEMNNALIQTVHGLGVKLLQRFAFEAGVSPNVEIIADDDHQTIFNKSLAMVLSPERIEEMSRLSDRLGLNKRTYTDWRRTVRDIIDTARSNDFSIEMLEKSKLRSVESFRQFISQPGTETETGWAQKLEASLMDAIERIEANADATKVTQKALGVLKRFCNRLLRKGELEWHEWMKIAKLKVGAKSKEDMAALHEIAGQIDAHPRFRKDIEQFVFALFDIAKDAIVEYAHYKNQRGLIDYVDMEALVNRLLDDEQVKEVLKEELDLLMVDEFQDTSPIQLSIFYKLSRLAKHAVWVGDPKQSIYGFRGADPKLMQAIISATGGIKPENIQEYSWRSREEVVQATNALFVKAFKELPVEQIALKPKRCILAAQNSMNKENEPLEMQGALKHWHFKYEGEGRAPGRPWFENCLAFTIKRFLENPSPVFDKAQKTYRKALAGDIAVLCRTNKGCLEVAEALHRAGLKAVVARKGLLDTVEIQLIISCLRVVLDPSDSLSVAEVVRLTGSKTLEEIVHERLEFLSKEEDLNQDWDFDDPFIKALGALRSNAIDLSSSEILDLLLDRLELRNKLVTWGNATKRMDNVEALRQLALQYEDACNRLHSGASLGGFLLWLENRKREEQDFQGAGMGMDTVHVLTYHKSKGLEWPLVICFDLEQDLKDRIFGLDLLSDQEDVNLNDILGNRWIRYWPNPFADQIRNTPLEERINESEVKHRAIRQALEEEARLFYVGMTRARDYLIFPSREKPTAWLNRIWNDGQSDIPTLSPDTHETPWEWGGKWLNIDTEVFLFGNDFTEAEMKPETSLAFQKSQENSAGYLPFKIDLYKEGKAFSAQLLGKEKQRWSYGQRLSETGLSNEYQAGKLLKAWMISDYSAYDQENRKKTAADLIRKFELEEDLDPEKLLLQSKGFLRIFDAIVSNAREYRKYPIEYINDGRLFETIIDIFRFKDDKLFIVQNSSASVSDERLLQKVQELMPWCFWVNKAFENTRKAVNVRVFINFVLEGVLVELEIKERMEAQLKMAV